MRKLFIVNSYKGPITLLSDPLFIEDLRNQLEAEIVNFGDGLDQDFDWRQELPEYSSPSVLDISESLIQEYVSTFTMSRSRLFKFQKRSSAKEHNLETPFFLRSQSMAFLNYAFEKLREVNPQLVLHSRVPHTGLDLSFWYAAKHLQIPSLFAWQSRIPNRFMLWEELAECTHFDKLQPLEESQQLSIEKTAERSWFYMNKKPHTKLAAIKSRSRLGVMSRSLELIMQKLYEIASVEHRAHVKKRKQFERQYADDYQQRVKDSVDTATPYIYFPLHREPEASTLPRAGLYADQLLGLEKLQQKCPANWKIYVKENPKQGYFCRDEYFFLRLSAMKNVVLVSGGFPTSKLIENSKLVATITGTAGWEAISSGKPTVYFASPWYQDLPGAFKFEQNTNLKEIADFEIDHAELEIRISDMASKMPKGLFFRRNVELPEDEVQNRKDCAEGIAQFALRNGYFPSLKVDLSKQKVAQ